MIDFEAEGLPTVRRLWFVWQMARLGGNGRIASVRAVWRFARTGRTGRMPFNVTGS